MGLVFGMDVKSSTVSDVYNLYMKICILQPAACSPGSEDLMSMVSNKLGLDRIRIRESARE